MSHVNTGSRWWYQSRLVSESLLWNPPNLPLSSFRQMVDGLVFLTPASRDGFFSLNIQVVLQSGVWLGNSKGQVGYINITFRYRRENNPVPEKYFSLPFQVTPWWEAFWQNLVFSVQRTFLFATPIPSSPLTTSYLQGALCQAVAGLFSFVEKL